MTRSAALLFSLFLVGCDSASVYEDCRREDKVGTGEERCFPSTFPKEDPNARLVLGYVSYDVEHIPNALVTIGDEVVTTDPGGFYRLPYAPFRYDVTARLADDVISFRGAALRFLDLAVERGIPPKAFPAKVVVDIEEPPRPGHRRKFFASGDAVVGLTEGERNELTVATRSFESTVRIHVVEYPESGGITETVAKGDVEVQVSAVRTATAKIWLAPMTEAKTSSFEADVPSGLTAGDVEIFLDFGSRYSEMRVATVPLGGKLTFPSMIYAAWNARLVAKRADGASASIGRRFFFPGDDVELAVFGPPEAVRNEGDVLFAESAQHKGVFEHTLVPLDGGGGGKTLHVFSASQSARVPDLAPLALPPASGSYEWTVRVFPDFTYVEQLSGVDVRLFRASGTSAPRTIVLP